MSKPRLRMIAGPNGSGKTSLIQDVLAKTSVPLGRYLNADDLELDLTRTKSIDFSKFGITTNSVALGRFCRSHPLAANLKIKLLVVRDNKLVVPAWARSGYLAAVIADYLRRHWISLSESFTFETVMSSEDKVKLLKKAQRLGYRTYAYYVCTDSPLISQERVKARVKQGGHDVPMDKIISRYARSLALLPKAIKYSSRAYLFDNSAKSHRLIAEFEAGVLVSAAPSLPNWFINAILKT